MTSRSIAAEVAPHLSHALYRPVEDLLSRPGKGFRGDLVEIGYLVSDARGDHAERTAARLTALSRLIETIHAGSLVVDDIEDGSPVRRGRPALHEAYGLPLALNAANWLYFRPLDELPSIGLPPGQELAVFRAVHRALANAHCGQALDLGVSIDEAPSADIPAICLASLRLKSGALMALGLDLGAILGEATLDVRACLSEAGHELGIGLQTLDDVGALFLPPDHPKRFEDMRLRRPTGVWKVLAEQGSPTEIERVRSAAASLPDTRALEAWACETRLLVVAVAEARARLDRVLRALHSSLAPTRPGAREGLRRLEVLIGRIAYAYA